MLDGSNVLTKDPSNALLAEIHVRVVPLIELGFLFVLLLRLVDAMLSEWQRGGHLRGACQRATVA